MRARRRPAAIASIKACRLVPLPDSSTPRASGSGIVLGIHEPVLAAGHRTDRDCAGPAPAEIGQHLRRTRGRHDHHEPDAVVEGTIHFGAWNSAEALDQPEDRRDAPAASLDHGATAAWEHAREVA